jgi:hypothetical protein
MMEHERKAKRDFFGADHERCLIGSPSDGALGESFGVAGHDPQAFGAPDPAG